MQIYVSPNQSPETVSKKAMYISRNAPAYRTPNLQNKSYHEHLENIYEIDLDDGRISKVSREELIDENYKPSFLPQLK